jgi:hypothetical protein
VALPTKNKLNKLQMMEPQSKPDRVRPLLHSVLTAGELLQESKELLKQYGGFDESNSPWLIESAIYQLRRPLYDVRQSLCRDM